MMSVIGIFQQLPPRGRPWAVRAAHRNPDGGEHYFFLAPFCELLTKVLSLEVKHEILKLHFGLSW
jgi:hypothetical protein